MIKEKFLINYYQWAKKEFAQEFKSDFVHLKTIASCRPVIEFVEKLSEHQQAFLVSALLKRAHREAVATLGEIITDGERMLLRDYLNFMSCATIQYCESDSQMETLNRRKFSENLETVLGAIVGDNIERGGQGYRRFSRKFGAINIETTFDTGGRIYQLQYEHKIWYGDTLIRDGISIVSWLGIAPGTTGWKKVNNENSYAVTDAFREVCSIFMNAVPSLIDCKRHA